MSEDHDDHSGSQFSLTGLLSWVLLLSLVAAVWIRRSKIAAFLLALMFVTSLFVVLVYRWKKL